MSTPTVAPAAKTLADYRGEVTVCKFCKSAVLPPPLRSYCKFCQTNGYVAVCLNCQGSGQIGAPDGWGTNTIMRSTCNICGGLGMLPAKPPVEIAVPTPEPSAVVAKTADPAVAEPVVPAKVDAA